MDKFSTCDLVKIVKCIGYLLISYLRVHGYVTHMINMINLHFTILYTANIQYHSQDDLVKYRLSDKGFPTLVIFGYPFPTIRTINKYINGM
jgi:hypothetical protein